MRLSTLLHDMISITAQADRDISGLELDSRKIKKNDLFCALKGTAIDGRIYITAAIERGAAAVLVDSDQLDDEVTFHQSIPLIPICHLKHHLGFIAARFYAHPAKQLPIIGVTGTNGKTSCTHFFAQALRLPCGIVGSLGNGLYGELEEVGLTTPDAATVQAQLNKFVQQGAKGVAMEVTSHGIDQGRVNGVPFEIGMFTNLTQDHLDYHGTMESYAGVKYRFLAEFPIKQLILNVDDPYGKQWALELAQSRPVYAYSCHGHDLISSHSAVGPIQDSMGLRLIYADQVHCSFKGITANVYTPWGNGKLTVPLIGYFNLSNVLGVLTALCLYGIPFEEVLTRLRSLKPVPGRMQTISKQGMPLVVVDFSHTPDSLEKALQTLRLYTQGKLICVFGCGGDRDPDKRPKMARVAEALADQVIVTNDNPRFEPPDQIAEQIVKGFTYPERVSVILDRSNAIKNSIQCAAINDCVLIAGKGAEHYQQIGDNKLPFDDVEEVNRCLAEKMNAVVVK